MSQEVLDRIKEAVIVGDDGAAASAVKEGLDAGMTPEALLNEGMIPGMDVVGVKFKSMEYFLPEVLISARAMHACLDILKPLLTTGEGGDTTTVLIGTVSGDLHDIGKNLVAMMLQGAGYDVQDLGVDVTPDAFAEKARETGAQFICLSSLLTTTMTSMPHVIEKLKETGIRDQVKVIIGGAPVTQNYADEIGADGYAADAASGVEVIKGLI